MCKSFIYNNRQYLFCGILQVYNWHLQQRLLIIFLLRQLRNMSPPSPAYHGQLEQHLLQDQTWPRRRQPQSHRLSLRMCGTRALTRRCFAKAIRCHRLHQRPISALLTHLRQPSWRHRNRQTRRPPASMSRPRRR